MVQEYQPQKCSSGGGGGGGEGDGGGDGDGGGINFKSSNRKPKQKKVPQRGLGVAQLEKIRLEEQKKDPSSPVRSIPNNPSFLHNQSSTPPRTDLASVFLQIPDVSHTNSNTTSCSTPWWSSSIAGHENMLKENPGGTLGFRSSLDLDLPYELSPIWPLPGLMQRSQQYQAHSSSMVHLLSASSSSSSVQNYQMEPPSNQSYHGNYTPTWQEEEKKVVGMKRPYPFSLDNPSGPFVQYKFPPVVHHHNGSRSDDSVSCLNGAKLNYEPCNPSYRDSYGPSCSTIAEKSTNENVISGGDFLTLAPPTTATRGITSSLTSNDISGTNRAFFNNGIPDFDSLLPYYYQGRNMEDSQQRRQPPYNQSFLPPELMAVHVFSQQPPTTIVNGDGRGGGSEVGENVDLNLKL
ncbi:hypothetical protein ACFE04_023259 [Oxalis oulophora]